MSQRGDIEKAIELHQRGKYDRAEKLYRRILKTNPDSVDALHFLGLLEHQRGHRRRALDLITRALELDPEYADAQNNLGNVLRDSGHLRPAEAAYREALRLQPSLAEALSNVGVLERARGNLDEAEALLRRAVDMVPTAAYAHFNLGTVLAARDQFEASLDHLRWAVELDGELAEAYLMMARVMRSTGRRGEALAIYDEILEIDPDNEVVRHMRAALAGEATPARASDGYIEQTFDRFSSTFEHQLTRLEYRAPELIRALVERACGEAAGDLDVLDLGCGTGWCGREIKPWARNLTGVDLSEGMLRFARRSGLYERVHRAELTAFLNSTRKSWDVVTMADTLCYFGDLEEVFTGVAKVLSAQGRVFFTVEAGEAPERGYELRDHGRYCHTERYVRDVLARAGLAVSELQADTLRVELGKAVPGFIVAAEFIDGSRKQMLSAD